MIDQFEETFTLCRSQEERAGFIDRLLTARRPDSRLRVVIAVRADFYGRCAEHRALAAALRGTSLLVGPMNQDELRQAIVGPAATQGALVERALTARLVTEVTDEPGGLPLLSHALLETWRRRKGRALTESSYEAAGGLRGAIAHTGEELYARLTPDEAALARHLLLRLITPGEGAPDTRRPADRAELLSVDPGAAPVLERLARARLITLEESSAELAHEALITAWPRLSTWVEEDRERLRLHRRLTDAASAWEESGRDTGALYRGNRLAAVEEAFAGRDGDVALTGHERAFLAAAVTARTRDRRRSRSLLGTLSVLLVLALVAGAVAWQQNRTSEKRRTEAVARKVSALANGMRFSDPVTAMRLSVAARRVADTPETRAGLMGAHTQPEEDVFTAPESLESQQFLSRDGRTLVVADRGHITKWDVRTKRTAGKYPGLGRHVGSATHLSPDARGLLVETEDGVFVWDIAAGRAGRPLGSPNAVGLGFGSTARTVVLGDTADVRPRVWDTARRRVLFTAPVGQVEAAVVSPDERMVALFPAGSRLPVWDMALRRGLPVPDSVRWLGDDT
ncbi:WD40 repeat domain-containing protein, partial [Streptomyces lasiicapitis]|uniref:WD40 repeat domain-containing protein n=1 Tax=Streptomyces lasiicapitis TaxID=1923961 RepID=UPI003692C763